MILLDTNIISTFCKIGKPELLYEVFNRDVLYISPNVFKELKKAKRYSFVDYALNLIRKKKLQVIGLDQKEMAETIKIPDSFAAGERDSIVICKSREYIFVTNERKVINYCKRAGIGYFDLRDILKAMHELMGHSKEKVNSLIDEIEKKDNIVIKDREEILG